LGVGLEEDAEESPAEPVGDPVLEVARLLDWEDASPEVGRHTTQRFSEAELAERLAGLQRVGEKLAPVIDARRTRALQQIVRQQLSPQLFHRPRLREEAMPANVEMKTLVA